MIRINRIKKRLKKKRLRRPRKVGERLKIKRKIAHRQKIDRIKMELERRKREKERERIERERKEIERLERERKERERLKKERKEKEKNEREERRILREINDKYRCIKNDLPVPFYIDEIKLEKLINSNNEKCLICLEIFIKGNQVMYLPCSHLFHSVCILRWLLKHSKCPICQTDYRGKVDDDKEEDNENLLDLSDLFNNQNRILNQLSNNLNHYMFLFDDDNDNEFFSNNYFTQRGRGHWIGNFNRRGNWRGRGRGGFNYRGRGVSNWRGRGNYSEIERGNFNGFRRFNNRGRGNYRGNRGRIYRGRGERGGRGRGGFRMDENGRGRGYNRGLFARGGLRGMRGEFHMNNSFSNNSVSSS